MAVDATSKMELDDPEPAETPGLDELRILAYDLGKLSQTIISAIGVLPPSHLEDLAHEVRHDWDITGMQSLITGAINTHLHGGTNAWVHGDRWKKPPGKNDDGGR